MSPLAPMGILFRVGCIGAVPLFCACSVPAVVFGPDDAGASAEAGASDDAGSPESSNDEAARGTGTPTPTTDASAAPPPEAGSPSPSMDECPAHPPKGAQGCCGATPCVGASCTKQCAECGSCSAGQVCCVAGMQGPGGGDQKPSGAGAVTCAADVSGCAGNGGS